jgi:mono/diheme cytochrome c family protein
MKKSISISLGLLLMAVLVAFSVASPPKPWPVSDAIKNKKNPVATSAASISNGKALYNLHCASCHGKKGMGDGSKAAQLDTDCGDFTTAEFQKQSDGTIFYKSLEGRDDMPSFKKKIPVAEDMWDVVNYIRTFKAK